MSRWVLLGAGVLLAVVIAFVVIDIVRDDGSGDDDVQRKAELLNESLEAAGFEPYSVEVTAEIYGTDAPSVCGVLESDWARDQALFSSRNPSGRRAVQIGPDQFEYDLLVVETYCPHLRDDLEDLVDDLRLDDSTR